MTDCPQFIETLYACWHLGAIAVPMNARGHATDFQYMLEHSRSRLCFVTADLEPTLRQATAGYSATAQLLVVGSCDLTGMIQQSDEAILRPVPQDGALPA